MIIWGIIFLLIAIVAAVLGFSRLSGAAAWAAKLIFVIGLILFVISIIMNYRS